MEGSLSLMQMAKISFALYNYQLNKKLFYVSILAFPIISGVIPNFSMLGNIIITEIVVALVLLPSQNSIQQIQWPPWLVYVL